MRNLTWDEQIDLKTYYRSHSAGTWDNHSSISYLTIHHSGSLGTIVSGQVSADDCSLFLCWARPHHAPSHGKSFRYERVLSTYTRQVTNGALKAYCRIFIYPGYTLKQWRKTKASKKKKKQKQKKPQNKIGLRKIN